MASASPELASDEKQDRQFIAWLSKLPEDDRILRIFDRKGSYTVHGKDTQYIARTFYKGTAVIKQMGKGQNQLETIVLNRSLYEQLLRDALVDKANRVVELYEGHSASWQISKCAPEYDYTTTAGTTGAHI
eukprot:jgi/Ulvmu1/596/UM001_0604.1